MVTDSRSSSAFFVAKYAFVLWCALAFVSGFLLLLALDAGSRLQAAQPGAAGMEHRSRGAFEEQGVPTGSGPATTDDVSMVWGNLQFDVVYQYVPEFWLAVVGLHLAWLLSVVAVVASVMALASSVRRQFLLNIMAISLLYLAGGIWFWCWAMLL